MGLRRPPGTTAALPGNSRSGFAEAGGSAGRSRYIIAPDPGPDTVDDLLPASVQSTSEVTKPAITQTHNILANDVQSTSEVTKPALGQRHALLANDTESRSELTKPTAVHVRNLLANDVESRSELTKPVLFSITPVSVTEVASPAGVAATIFVSTYTGQSIGSASSGRIIVVAAGSELGFGSIDQAEIDYGSGYVTMNAAPQGRQGINHARLFWLRVPTGTTADFKITFGGNSPTATQNKIAIYRVMDAVVADSGSDASTDLSTVSLTTGSITVPSYGLFFAVATGAVDTDAKTWTNATAFVDSDVGSFRFTTARRTTSGSVTVSVAGAASGEDGGLSWLTFLAAANANELLANDVESASSLTKPAITQTHGILANDVQSASELTKPAVGQRYGLLANDVESASAVTTPVLAQIHNILANDVFSASSLSVPLLSLAVPPEPIFTGKVKGRKKDRDVEGRKKDAGGKARVGSDGIIGRSGPGTIRGRK